MRRLTDGEIALARTAFGDGIDYLRVRIRDGPGRNPAALVAFSRGHPAIALGATLHFKGRCSEDFSAAPVSARGLFMHEMTHVWQYRALGMARFLLRYVRELAACGFRPGALYLYRPGETPFRAATLEAQAEMAADYAGAALCGDAARARALERNLRGSGLYGL